MLDFFTVTKTESVSAFRSLSIIVNNVILKLNISRQYLRFEKCLYIGSVLQHCHDPSDIPITSTPTPPPTTLKSTTETPELPVQLPDEPRQVEFSENASSFNKMLTKPECRGNVHKRTINGFEVY